VPERAGRPTGSSLRRRVARAFTMAFRAPTCLSRIKSSSSGPVQVESSTLSSTLGGGVAPPSSRVRLLQNGVAMILAIDSPSRGEAFRSTLCKKVDL
jgi:hypothetical protein